MGPLITIATIRLALTFFAMALVFWAMRFDPSIGVWPKWIQAPSAGRAVRWIWTMGFGFFVAHVLAAFHFYHGWSHQAALDDTARKTEQLLGWQFGEGIYFSYIFLILWGIDCAVGWNSSLDRRPKWLVTLWLSYLSFIAFNGAAVFESGPTRWGAWITVGLLVAIAIGHTWALRSNSLCAPHLNDRGQTYERDNTSGSISKTSCP